MCENPRGHGNLGIRLGAGQELHEDVEDEDGARIADLLSKVRALPPMTEEERNEQHASFAYVSLAMTKEYADASPEKLEALRQLCRRMAGCKT